MAFQLTYRIPHDEACRRGGESVSLVNDVMDTLRTCAPPVRGLSKLWVVKTVVIKAEIGHMTELERTLLFARMASEAADFRR